MSRFLNPDLRKLTPYTPGEQPRERTYIKLNTNECPYPPSPKARARAREALETLNLYPDPTCKGLTQAACQVFGVSSDQVFWGNGSDEVLFCAFTAFCNRQDGAQFPAISYGFYPVFAGLCGIPQRQIPLREDWTIDPAPYCQGNQTVFLANPNAPTGLALNRQEIRGILDANPNRVVVVDEAYIDFGGESALPLIPEYPNLLVVQTFSKSRSMAGARLGVGFGQRELIADLNLVKYALNPYNINAMTMAAGIGTLEDEDYRKACCQAVCKTREETARALAQLGFTVLPSQANFLFVTHRDWEGKALYRALKARGILVRHFGDPKLTNYNRITVGTPQEMESLLNTLRSIQKEGL